MTVTLARWSLDEYHQMIDAGILADRQVELLHGQIIQMAPEGPEHAGRSETLADLIRHKLGDRAWIREARPITLADSEPEPDIAVVNRARSPYIDRHPYPEDILWVVEVSQSTLKTDLTSKRDLYASAGIPEYWVVDLHHRCVHLFCNLEGTAYTDCQKGDRGTISPRAFPDCTISVPGVFG